MRLGACQRVNLTSVSMTDAKGLHGLSCKGGTCQSARHQSLNDLIWRERGKVHIPLPIASCGMRL